MNFVMLLSLLLVGGECKRFLFIPMHWGDSHKKSMLLFADELAEMGHEVSIWQTTLTPHKQVSTLVREIHDQTFMSDDPLHRDLFLHGNVTIDDNWETDRYNALDNIVIWYYNILLCHNLIKHRPERLEAIASEHWDIIFVGSYLAPCGYIIQKLSKAPYISYSTSHVFDTTTTVRGINYQLATAPNFWTRYNYEYLKFGHRVEQIMDQFKNFISDKVAEAMMAWFLSPWLRDDFSMLANFERGALFSFSGFPLGVDVPRPQAPIVKYVGELECVDENMELPSDYEALVEDTESKGTIVAAFGHYLDWNSASSEHLNMFVETFKKLTNYRIVWQYTGSVMLDLEDHKHIKIVQWLPQRALLNHPKTKTFISHGGLKSTMEALCTNVSMIFMPLFAEQARNSWAMQRHGFSTTIGKQDPAVEVLETAIYDLLENAHDIEHEKFEFQRKMTDHLTKPSKLGEFWSLFALRHESEIKKWFNLKCTMFGGLTHFCIDCICIFILVVVILTIWV